MVSGDWVGQLSIVSGSPVAEPQNVRWLRLLGHVGTPRHRTHMPRKPKTVSPTADGNRPQLGLVCQTRRAHSLSHHHPQRSLRPARCRSCPRLREIFRHNVERLASAIAFCREQSLRLYRMPSSLFPFSDTPDYAHLLDDLAPVLGQIGTTAKDDGLRLVMHPDQFVVLSSDSASVVENSRTILCSTRACWIFAAAAVAVGRHQHPRGKAGRLPALVAEIRRLPESVRARLTLENDELAYGSDEILQACTQAGVAMVFDAHHHVIYEELDRYDDRSLPRMLAAAARTWPQAGWQMTHISNGEPAFSDRAHSDYITTMPPCFRDAPFIEVEAKAKDLAIAQLRTTSAA